MSAVRAVLALALVVSSLTACRGSSAEGGGATLSQTRFVDVMVALRRMGGPTTDSAAFRMRRDSLLHSMGVTSQDLVRFARVHGDNVAYMSVVWDSVEARLKRAR